MLARHIFKPQGHKMLTHLVGPLLTFQNSLVNLGQENSASPDLNTTLSPISGLMPHGTRKTSIEVFMSRLPDRPTQGWLLFVASSFGFLTSGVRDGDVFAIAGSLLFLAGCALFLWPTKNDVDAQREDPDAQ